jgi:hypothetical protein
VFVYDAPPGEPIIAERIAPWAPTQEGGHAHVQLPIGERLTVGYVAGRGAGRVVVLGVSPTPELLLALHAWLEVPIGCRAGLGQRVHSALFRRGDDVYFLVVTNTADHPQDARVHLEVPVSLRTARDLRSGDESAVVDSSVVVRVPARSGTIMRLTR